MSTKSYIHEFKNGGARSNTTQGGEHSCFDLLHVLNWIISAPTLSRSRENTAWMDDYTRQRMSQSDQCLE